MFEKREGQHKAKLDTSAMEGRYRNQLAFWITVISITGVIVLGITVIALSGDAEHKDSAQLVLTGVLPLLGAWVGTVLAYYFSKENFEAATRSVSEFSRKLSGDEALAAIGVESVMIERDTMLTFELPASSLILSTVLDQIDQADKGSRIPIISGKGQPKFVIHRSVIDRYLVEKARAGASQSDIEKLTLENFFSDDPKREDKFSRSFTTVGPKDNLSEAKKVMEQEPGIQDVFVTTTGKRDGELLGWITNVIISEHSVVTSQLKP